MQIARGTLARALAALLRLEQGLLQPPRQASSGVASLRCPTSSVKSASTAQLSLQSCDGVVELGAPWRAVTSPFCRSASKSGSSRPQRPKSLTRLRLATAETSDTLLERQVPPLARLTDEDHPRGVGLIEYPFNAKAFYVGELPPQAM